MQTMTDVRIAAIVEGIAKPSQKNEREKGKVQIFHKVPSGHTTSPRLTQGGPITAISKWLDCGDHGMAR